MPLTRDERMEHARDMLAVAHAWQEAAQRLLRGDNVAQVAAPIAEVASAEEAIRALIGDIID